MLYLLGFPFIFAIWSLLFLFLYQLHVPIPVLISLVGLFLGALLVGIVRTSQIRLEISDHGITYCSGYYVISSSWDNVERIGKRVLGIGRFPVEGLILRGLSATKTSFMARVVSSNFMGLFSFDKMAYEVDYSRSIPLQGIWSWDWDWRKSKAAEDIRQYLPDLFGEQ
jgi:hypothetical protein